jgi:hypothetical protein
MYVSVLILAVPGVLLGYFGQIGNTEIELFGQTIKMINLGIAAIFIGAVANVFMMGHVSGTIEEAVKSELKKGSVEKSSEVMKDVLSIITVTTHQRDDTCLLVFMLKNEGIADVVILNVEFEVIDVVTIGNKSSLDFSTMFDMDISHLEKIGDSTTFQVERQLKPGESKRFGLVLSARKMGLSTFRGWKLRPILKTDSGDIECPIIEIWLPTRFQEFSFADAKIEVQHETNPTKLSHLIKNLKESGENFSSYAVNTVADQLLWSKTTKERRDAARALGEIGQPAEKIALMLLKAKKDHDEKVRKLAILALGKLTV